MSIIALASLIMGISVNQFVPGGIRLKRLISPIPADAASRVFIVISAESAFLLYKGNETLFVDIRPHEDFGMDHIPGALSFPYSTILSDTFLLNLNHQKKMVIYDFDPASKNAEIAAGTALDLGFKQVFVMHGGFSEWLGNHYPVESGGRS